MLSHRERVLKINYATSFRISDPDQLSDAVDVTGNRELLEKMLPQFKGRDLESFICPLAISFRIALMNLTGLQ